MTQTFYDDAEVPAIPTAEDGVSLTLATRIVPAVDGNVTHGRWRFPNTPTSASIPVVWGIYRNSDSALLASKAFPLDVPQAGWSQVLLDAPVPMLAGVEYSWCVWTPDRYVATSGYLASDITRGDLTALSQGGRFGGEGQPSITFPNNSFGSASYFPDGVFVPAGGSTPISVSEAGSGSEAITVNAAVPLAVAGAAADTVAVTAAVPVTEAASAGDAIAVSVTSSTTDTASAVEAVAAAVSAAVADAAAATETVTVLVSVPAADIGGADDSVAVAAASATADAGSATETVTVVAAVAVAETGTAVDSVTVEQPGSPTDTGSATETVTVVVMVNVSDSGSATDSVTTRTPVVAYPHGVRIATPVGQVRRTI